MDLLKAAKSAMGAAQTIHKVVAHHRCDDCAKKFPSNEMSFYQRHTLCFGCKETRIACGNC
jgi:hypothetical protein